MRAGRAASPSTYGVAARSRRSSGRSALLAVTLSACGARSQLLAGMTGDAAPDSMMSAPEAGDAGVGANLPCRLDQPSTQARVALAVAAAGAVTLIKTDGSVQTPYQFQPYPPPDGSLFDVTLVQHAGYVLASASWWGPTAAAPCVTDTGLLVCPERNHLILLDLGGRVQWEKEFSGRVSSAREGLVTSLGDGGIVLAIAYGRGVLIAPDGTERDPPPASPAAQPSRDADAPAADASSTPAWTPPDGTRWMSSAGDLDGAFVGVFRDDTMAAVYRSANAAPPWTRIGSTLTDVETVAVGDVAGTYVIDALGTEGFFAPTQKWPAPDAGQADLRGTSYQLARPADGVIDVIRPFLFSSVVLTKDGLCAAYWDDASNGRQLTVLDIVRGASVSALTNGGSVPYPIAVWIE